MPIEPATPDDCDISTNPIVLVSRVMSGRLPGIELRLRTLNDGPSPLPFIDDPCQLRAIAKVVTGGCGVNASLLRARLSFRARERMSGKSFRLRREKHLDPQEHQSAEGMCQSKAIGLRNATSLYATRRNLTESRRPPVSFSEQDAASGRST